MPRVAQRQIPIFYKPPHVGVMEIDKVILYYNNSIPIPDIIRRCQLARSERDNKCLSYPDLYTILFHAAKDGRVKQRNQPEGEMPIKDFPAYFQIFRDGGTFEECWNALSPEAQRLTSKTFHTRLFRAMGDRHREYHRKQVDLLDRTSNEEKERMLVSTLLMKFKRLKLGLPGQSRSAIVLFLDELPLEFLNQLHLLNTDFSREILLAVNPTMLSEMEAHAVRHKQQLPPPTKILSRDQQKQLADDAVKALELSLDYEAVPVRTAASRNVKQNAGAGTHSDKLDKPDAPIDPEDEAELSILTADQLKELEQQEQLTVKPASAVQLPSAHQPASQSPGYDLSNLVDDDPLDAGDESASVVE